MQQNAWIRRFFGKNLPMPEKCCPPITLARAAFRRADPVHLIIALADHFEPAYRPEDGHKRVARDEQLRREEVVGPRISESHRPLARS